MPGAELENLERLARLQEWEQEFDCLEFVRLKSGDRRRVCFTVDGILCGNCYFFGFPCFNCQDFPTGISAEVVFSEVGYADEKYCDYEDYQSDFLAKKGESCFSCIKATNPDHLQEFETYEKYVEYLGNILSDNK
jgi:hypothetical protein